MTGSAADPILGPVGADPMETSSQTSPSGPAPSADEPAGSGRVDTDPAGPTQDERTWALGSWLPNL